MLRQLLFLGVAGVSIATMQPKSAELGMKIDNEISGAKSVPVQPRTTIRPSQSCGDTVFVVDELLGMKEPVNSFTALVSVLTRLVTLVYGAAHCENSHTISLSRIVAWYRFMNAWQPVISVHADLPGPAERISASALHGVAKPDFTIKDIQSILGRPIRQDRISRGLVCDALLSIVMLELDGLRETVTTFAKTPLMLVRTDTEKRLPDAQKLEALLKAVSSIILYSPPSSDLKSLLSQKLLIPEKLATVEDEELISTYVPSPLRHSVLSKMSQRDAYRQVLRYLNAPLSNPEMDAVVAQNSFILESLGRHSSFTIQNPSDVALVLNLVATADTYVALLSYLKGANARWVSFFDETDDEVDLMSGEDDLSEDEFSETERSPNSV